VPGECLPETKWFCQRREDFYKYGGQACRIVYQAKWYLALTYLKENKMERAKAILWEISKSSTYGEKAQKLLKKLTNPNPDCFTSGPVYSSFNFCPPKIIKLCHTLMVIFKMAQNLRNFIAGHRRRERSLFYTTWIWNQSRNRGGISFTGDTYRRRSHFNRLRSDWKNQKERILIAADTQAESHADKIYKKTKEYKKFYKNGMLTRTKRSKVFYLCSRQLNS